MPLPIGVFGDFSLSSHINERGGMYGVGALKQENLVVSVPKKAVSVFSDM